MAQQAVNALAPAGAGGDDPFAGLRSAGAGVLAKLLRLSMPVPLGEQGEQLARQFLDAGIKVSAKGAADLRMQLENRLRARLNPQQFTLFLNPHQQLAHALAEGFRAVAQWRPLLVLFDTYEIVDRADIWVREMIMHAGPRTIWVISGRNNLAHSRDFGAEYVTGYNEYFPQRLVERNLPQLARQDVQEIFDDLAPERPLDEADLAALSQATRGVPLAIHQAAELWARGLECAAIVGGISAQTPRDSIVQVMSERYFMHASAADKPALYALALADGDLLQLQAMLRPDAESNPEFDALLARLERDYASVYASGSGHRLYDEPAFFLREQLKQERYRTDAKLRALVERAVAALRERIATYEAELDLLDERCRDEDWAKYTQALCERLFWLDEQQAWRWLIPRYIEGLAYSASLRRSLLSVAEAWRPQLSKGKLGQGRLAILRNAEALRDDQEAQGELLRELERFERQGHLAGAGESERRAILDWQRGLQHARGDRLHEALAAYERAEAVLDQASPSLREQVGEALYALAGELLWPQGRRSAIYSAEAAEIISRVVAYLPDKQEAWYCLGVAMHKAGRYKEALVAFNKAQHLDPRDAAPWSGRGHVYRSLGRYEEALAAYQEAQRLDPKETDAWHGTGLVHHLLGQFDQALAAHRHAVTLAPNDGSYRITLAGLLRAMGREADAAAELARAQPLMEREDIYNRACFAAISGDHTAALDLLREALADAPGLRDWAQHDPDFASLRDDPRFVALVE